MAALFSRKSKDAQKASVPAPTAAAQSGGDVDVSHVLQRPRITEKATVASGMSVYVFDVEQGATKRQIRSAVERYYKVRPRRVRVVSIPAKRVRSMRTGERGVKRGGKKAYVYLKKGETITIA